MPRTVAPLAHGFKQMGQSVHFRSSSLSMVFTGPPDCFTSSFMSYVCLTPTKSIPPKIPPPKTGTVLRRGVGTDDMATTTPDSRRWYYRGNISSYYRRGAHGVRPSNWSRRCITQCTVARSRTTVVMDVRSSSSSSSLSHRSWTTVTGQNRRMRHGGSCG